MAEASGNYEGTLGTFLMQQNIMDISALDSGHWLYKNLLGKRKSRNTYKMHKGHGEKGVSTPTSETRRECDITLLGITLLPSKPSITVTQQCHDITIEHILCLRRCVAEK